MILLYEISTIKTLNFHLPLLKEADLDSLLNALAFDFDSLSFSFLAGWTILNKSPYPKKILMKLRGNESGQIRHVPAHTSVIMPDNVNYRFWDAETHVEIAPCRQVIVNKDGFFE